MLKSRAPLAQKNPNCSYQPTSMKSWILYVLALGFTTYWACNLMLWFPWSYSTSLGIVLMLTVAPLLWLVATYLALKSYHGKALFKGSGIIAMIFLLQAVLMDYIFFGIIRNAMDELFHPTTFYGYAFLLFWPLIIAIVFRKRLSDLNEEPTKTKTLMTAFGGLAFFGALTLIILLGIKI